MGIIDTAADISLISEKYISRCFGLIKPCSLTLSGILLGDVIIEREVTVDVEVGEENIRLKFDTFWD